MNEKIKRQILAIRDTGLSNMFDVVAVQRLAYDRQMWELVQFIEECERDYVEFILHGKEEK